MLVFEYQCKLKFLKSINHKTIAEKINYFLDSVLAKDQEFLQYHENKGYKYYVTDAPWPIEKDGIYKEGKVYTLRIRTVKQELAEFFSEKLYASKYTGIKVKQMLFEELNDQNIYDGIWACASILHLSKSDLFLVFHKMNKALKENGIIYTSFKYGEFEGERNGRYFTDFTEDSLKEFILQIPQLQIKEIWTTGDVREGRGDERWLNILICKGKIS